MGARLDPGLLHGHYYVEPVCNRCLACMFTVFGHCCAVGRSDWMEVLDLGQAFLAYLSFWAGKTITVYWKIHCSRQMYLAGCSSKANWWWIVRIMWRGKWDGRWSSTLDDFTNRTKSTVAVRIHGSTLCGEFKVGNEKTLNLEKYL